MSFFRRFLTPAPRDHFSSSFSWRFQVMPRRRRRARSRRFDCRFDFPLAQFPDRLWRDGWPDCQIRRRVLPRTMPRKTRRHPQATATRKRKALRELHAVETKARALDKDVAGNARAGAAELGVAESQRPLFWRRAEIEKISQAARSELAASERAAPGTIASEIAASLAVRDAAALVSSR